MPDERSAHHRLPGKPAILSYAMKKVPRKKQKTLIDPAICMKTKARST
jgi:hypothetical protein